MWVFKNIRTSKKRSKCSNQRLFSWSAKFNTFLGQRVFLFILLYYHCLFYWYIILVIYSAINIETKTIFLKHNKFDKPDTRCGLFGFTFVESSYYELTKIDLDWKEVKFVLKDDALTEFHVAKHIWNQILFVTEWFQLSYCLYLRLGIGLVQKNQ